MQDRDRHRPSFHPTRSSITSRHTTCRSKGGNATTTSNTLSSIFSCVLQLFLIVQAGVFIGYYFALPTLQSINGKKGHHVSNLRSTGLHNIQVGKFVPESYADVRMRQIQNAIRAKRAFAKEDNFDDLSANGGIVRFSNMLVDAIEKDVPSDIDTLKSCFGYEVSYGNGGTAAPATVSPSSKCRSTEIARSKQTMLVVFNPYPRRRRWCGHTIDAGQVVTIDDISSECQESWMNLAVYPPPSLAEDADDGIEIITSSFVHGQFDELQVRTRSDCDVPCVWKGPAYGTLRVSGTKWLITQSAEGPRYYDELNIDPEAHLKDHYYSTTSFQSEIPLPYFSWGEYDIKSKPVRYDEAIKGASFIANNCGSMNDRESLVTGIQESGFRVDSLSGCLHNAEPPNGLGMENKNELMRQYLFHLAFENQNEDDYITEKLWGSLQAGTVPVYFGAPNIREHAPAGSIVIAADFGTPKALGEYLSRVASDKKLYERYHIWRRKDYPSEFAQKYNFTFVHSECRTCRWAFARKKGLGFNHEQQTITPPRLSREVCTNEMTGLIHRPFKESYLSYDMTQHTYADALQTHQSTMTDRENESAKGSRGHATCSKRGVQSTFVFSSLEIERSVVEHDNIIDITFEVRPRHVHKRRSSPPLFLRFESRIQSNRVYFTAFDHRSPVSRRTFNSGDTAHWQTAADGMKYIQIKDRNSTVSVWADWETQMYSPFDGAIDVLLSADTHVMHQAGVIYRRIRVIVEDSDQLHYDDNVGVPSYFAKNAAKDFYHPLEFLYSDGS